MLFHFLSIQCDWTCPRSILLHCHLNVCDLNLSFPYPRAFFLSACALSQLLNPGLICSPPIQRDRQCTSHPLFFASSLEARLIMTSTVTDVCEPGAQVSFSKSELSYQITSLIGHPVNEWELDSLGRSYRIRPTDLQHRDRLI